LSASSRVFSPLCYLAAAAAAALLAGCAGTPQNPSSQAAPAEESPASASKMVDTADFTKRAQDDGWRPEVRNGQVLYCKDEAPLGSRLPEMTCLNKTGVEQMMLAEDRQRQQLQRSTQAPGIPQ
jgi:hypothetical protein